MLTLNQLKQYYNSAPQWMKDIYALIPYDLRNGAEYRKWRNFLEKELPIAEYETLKLRETVIYAYENTVFYKNLYDSLDISPHEIRTYEDFAQLPFIDKSVVKQNYNDLLAHTYPSKKTFFVTTGGSSGSPTKFLQSKNVWSKELAYTMHFFKSYGYKPCMLKASLRGGEFGNLKKNIYWKRHPYACEIQFSPFHLNDETVRYYCEELNRKQIKYLQAYPSSIEILMQSMTKNNLKLNYKLEAVFLLSESISEDTVERIKAFFGCKVGSFYGHSERLVFAPSLHDNVFKYKVNRYYGLFELVDSFEKPIKENNKTGEIVGTSFDNFAMPLIRYKTDDFTSFSDHENAIIHKVEGRKNEYILTSKGDAIPITSLNVHSEIYNNVLQYQYVQHQKGEVELHLKVNEYFTNDEMKIIEETLNKAAGGQIHIDVKIVNSFMLTPRGKFVHVFRTF